MCPVIANDNSLQNQICIILLCHTYSNPVVLSNGLHNRLPILFPNIKSTNPFPYTPLSFSSEVDIIITSGTQKHSMFIVWCQKHFYWLLLGLCQSSLSYGSKIQNGVNLVFSSFVNITWTNEGGHISNQNDFKVVLLHQFGSQSNAWYYEMYNDIHANRFQIRCPLDMLDFRSYFSLPTFFIYFFLF